MEPIKISRDGVYKLIKNIKPSKATGPDTIAGRVLKENIAICTDILTLLFTKSLETGKVPSVWNHEAWLIWFIYFNIKNHVFYISPV
jgi:hypothetical protein